MSCTDNGPLFTVLTPTHNRAEYLARLHTSLCRQTLCDFEWLVIDDGSSDHTADVIADLRQASPLRIRYVDQSKAGKHVAFNRGVREANGAYIVDVDSDDELLPDALKTLYGAWMDLPVEQRKRLAGVLALAIDENSTTVGGCFPQSRLITDLITLRFRYRIKGDKRGFNRRDILRQFPFPEPDNSKLNHVPERIVWFRIARNYDLLCINEPVSVYHSDPQADQLTAKSFPSRADTALLSAQAALNEHIDWFWYRPRHFTHAGVKFTRAAFHLEYSLLQQYRLLRPRALVLWLLALPKAFLYFRGDRKREIAPD